MLGKDSIVARAIVGAQAMMIEGLRGELVASRVDSACSQLRRYLMVSMGSLPDEVLRVLFVDSAGYLIADEQLQSGTLAQVAIHPRTIFRRAMELNAAGLILVHNHPSGDPRPSEEDIIATHRLIEVGHPLSIEIIDHIIVSDAQSCSVLGKSWKRSKLRAAMSILREGPGGAGNDGQSEYAAALANAMRTARRRILRRQLVGAPELFGEPAWDMLIDLFIQQCQGIAVSTSALGIGSGRPSSSGLRLVQKLCDANLIEKFADPDDARRQFVRLNPDLAWKLQAYFSADDDDPQAARRQAAEGSKDATVMTTCLPAARP